MQIAIELSEGDVSRIERDRAECDRPTGNVPGAEGARQTTSDMLSEIRPVPDHFERYQQDQKQVTDPPTNKASRLDWEMIALWSFVVFSFATLIYTFYILSAKIDGNSPF